MSDDDMNGDSSNNNVFLIRPDDPPCGPNDREALDYLTRENTHAIRRIEATVDDLHVAVAEIGAGQTKLLRMVTMVVDELEHAKRQRVAWPKLAVLATILLAIVLGTSLSIALLSLFNR